MKTFICLGKSIKKENWRYVFHKERAGGKYRLSGLWKGLSTDVQLGNVTIFTQRREIICYGVY